jgi:hypothetical protein
MRWNARVRSSSRRPCRGAGALQADPRDAKLGQGAVACGEPEAAVCHHGGRRPPAQRGHAAHRRQQLRRIRRVALGQLVAGDEPAFVFAEQQGVAELGRRAGLALADRAGIRSANDTTGRGSSGCRQAAGRSARAAGQ